MEQIICIIYPVWSIGNKSVYSAGREGFYEQAEIDHPLGGRRIHISDSNPTAELKKEGRTQE